MWVTIASRSCGSVPSDLAIGFGTGRAATRQSTCRLVTHRITLSPEAEMEGLALEDLLRRIFDQVEVPR